VTATVTRRAKRAAGDCAPTGIREVHSPQSG
jgi:hypothetical protein